MIYVIRSEEQTTKINFNLRFSGGFNHDISIITNLISQYDLEAVMFFLKALKYLTIK